VQLDSSRRRRRWVVAGGALEQGTRVSMCTVVGLCFLLLPTKFSVFLLVISRVPAIPDASPLLQRGEALPPPPVRHRSSSTTLRLRYLFSSTTRQFPASATGRASTHSVAAAPPPRPRRPHVLGLPTPPWRRPRSASVQER
jgi:hypothetical protein